MNVGNVGATTYNAWVSRANEAKTKGNTSFGNVMENQGAETHLVLHGVSDEMKAQGYVSVGAWADARTGVSTTIYKPQDFDENNPVYLMKVWDADGNVTEKEVNLNEINPANSDSLEMYAYSCYLSDSGKYPEAQNRYMMAHAHYAGEEGVGETSYEDMLAKVDWLEVVKGIMKIQYEVGNMQGYLEYKGFYDFLLSESGR